MIAALAAALLAFLWLGETDNAQNRVFQTAGVLLLTGFLLLVWLLFFSRLRWGLRLRLFASLLVLGTLAATLFEVRGVSGDLVPILGFRFEGERQFARLTESVPELEAPAPGDYPQFLGPGRDATLDGPELGRDWLANPPRELWRREVGEGWSAFAVVGDAAVTQEQRGDLESVVRYDLETGEEVWIHTDPARFETVIGGVGPRATPTIAGGRVYTVGATGLLNCLDLETGERLWSVDTVAQTGGVVPDWGKSCSPLVTGDKVVVSAGGPAGSSLVAYHRITGERLWGGGSDGSGYSSPSLHELAGVPQIVILNRGSVAGHDPSTGELLWSHEWAAQQPNVAQPVPVGPDRLLVSSGYGIGTSLLEISRGGDGFAVEEIWRSPRLKAKFANFVVKDGTIYGLDDGTFTAVDAATGQRLWKRGRYGHGQLLLVDDLILLQAEDGELVLLEAHPGEHRELATFPVFDTKTWNSPVLAGRYLLVRNHLEAACFELPVAG